MPKFSSKTTENDTAVFASSGGAAVLGESSSTSVAAITGVQLDLSLASGGAGVYGECRGGGAGIEGLQVNAASSGAGVYGESRGVGAAIVGRQVNVGGSGAGVHGECKGSGHAVSGIQLNPNSDGAGIYGEHAVGKTAGFFRGNLVVTGDVSFPGADCAEEFSIKGQVLAEPGTVMVLSTSGELVPCDTPYEKKVVGVVAGAGSLRPGIIMGRLENSSGRREPIALVGTTFCKVDASHGAIAVGDLLTGSSTQGHAMKAHDTARAFGAVIGKAMAALDEGCGLIPILIALQ